MPLPASEGIAVWFSGRCDTRSAPPPLTEVMLLYYSGLKMAAFDGSEWDFLSSHTRTDVIDSDGFCQCYGQN